MRFSKKLSPIFKTKKRFIPIHGGRASGKSWAAAAKTVLMAASGYPCVATREIATLIDGNIKALIEGSIERLQAPGFSVTDRIIRHNSGGHILTLGLKGGSIRETRTRIKGLEDYMWLWMEEAESASEEILTNIMKTIRRSGSQQCYTFNRYLEIDPIYGKLCKDLDPRTTEEIIVNYWDNKDCPEEEVYEAEKLKKNDYESWLYIYGGEPMSQSEQAIISRTAVSRAISRDPDIEGQIQIGADIARFGSDTTTFFKRKGMAIIDFRQLTKQRTTEIARQLMDFAEQDKKIPIKVDDTGVGGGVVDILHEAGYSVIPVNNGEQAKDPDKYPNAISEQWFEFQGIIDETTIPDIDRLKMELTSRFFKLDSKGRRVVESKEDYKKRGFSSPDLADGLLLCYYQPMFMNHMIKGSVEMGRRKRR
jgi:phage terminase large subunit